MAISKFEAILSLTPNAEFECQDDVIVVWHSDDITQPTDDEINAEQVRLQTEFDNKQYQRDRAVEYPAIGEQLDYIYHNGLEAWKTDIIQPIKEAHPKPESP